MTLYYDKLLLFICCITLYIIEVKSSNEIIPILLAAFFTGLSSYYQGSRLRLGFYLIYIALCFLFPTCFIFMPLFIYDIITYDYNILCGLIFLPLISNYGVYNTPIIMITLLFCGCAWIIKNKSHYSHTLMLEYNELQDTTKELSILQEEKNQSLLDNQDYEINVATLKERNRISKEIHDNIGHLLSRSLLQIGALLIITKDEATKVELTILKESISKGMDSIRESIHNIHDESIDLYSSIETIVNEFSFCPINFEYDIKSNLSSKLKYNFISIVKEGLANIIKHSNATRVTITIREHPALYQLIILDNGIIEEQTIIKLNKLIEKQMYYDGIGLQNIVDRVKSFDGNINITFDSGCKIFITIPK